MNSDGFRPATCAWLVLCIVSVPVAEILLKLGASASVKAGNADAVLGISNLLFGYTWAGITVYILNFVCWIQVLRQLSLSIAYTMMSSVHALVPIGSWLVLHETIGPRRTAGIAMVLLGIVLVAGPAMQAEGRL